MWFTHFKNSLTKIAYIVIVKSTKQNALFNPENNYKTMQYPNTTHTNRNENNLDGERSPNLIFLQRLYLLRNIVFVI